MDEPVRYRHVLARCLEQEDRAHRESVLAEYDERVQRMVRRLMEGLARRLAARVRFAGADAVIRGPGYAERRITAEERRERRVNALAAIEPDWLRDRVEAMVREQFANIRWQQRQMRVALGD